MKTNKNRRYGTTDRKLTILLAVFMLVSWIACTYFLVESTIERIARETSEETQETEIQEPAMVPVEPQSGSGAYTMSSDDGEMRIREKELPDSTQAEEPEGDTINTGEEEAELEIITEMDTPAATQETAPVESYAVADTVGDEIVEFSDDMPETKKQKFFELYHKEPVAIRQYLVNHGARILVAPDGRYTHGHAGEYGFNTGIVNINAGTDKKLAMSVNHEIGHFLDETLGREAGMANTVKAHTQYSDTWLSNMDEFQSIYEAEASSAGYPSYNSYCTPEFFAETYRYVIENNTAMMAKAPRAAEFVKAVIAGSFS